MRHQLYRPAVTVVGVAAALAVCASPRPAAAARGREPGRARLPRPSLLGRLWLVLPSRLIAAGWLPIPPAAPAAVMRRCSALRRVPG
jgi:hypothetical protein